VLAANFPGHDATAATEAWDEFGPALEAWVDRAGGAERLVLQGHSLGALKVLHYMQSKSGKLHDMVRGLILLSPFDIVAFYGGPSEDAIVKKRRVAEDLRATKGAAALLPPDMFDLWPISLGTYLELGASNGPADQFPVRHGLSQWHPPEDRLPLFIAIGGSDFAALPSPEVVVGACLARKKALAGKADIDVSLIEGAPHNFDGKIDELVRDLRGWTQSHRLP
jgi:pimeloyl-ACP methyl ester carboxylesterase